MLQIDQLIAPANSPRSAPASLHPISAMEVERQNHEAELLTLTGIHPSLFSSLAVSLPRRLHLPSHVMAAPPPRRLQPTLHAMAAPPPRQP
jgi:hypothetical protein